MNLDLIPKTQVNFKRKCEICVQAKQTRKAYKSVERNSQLLELIHSDVCDFNRQPTRVGNKYFVTFIDYCSRYCYVYLIKTKMKYSINSKFLKQRLKTN